MSSVNKLQSIFSETAEAIRGKLKTTELIKPVDFSSKINEIGNSSEVKVNIYNHIGITVDNSTIIDKVYINKNLDINSIRAIINKLEYYSMGDYTTTAIYAVMSTNSKGDLLIQKIKLNGKIEYLIYLQKGESYKVLFQTAKINTDFDFIGWNPKFLNELTINESSKTYIATFPTLIVGDQNDKLIQLFYTLQPEVAKTLSGSFDGSTISAEGTITMSTLLDNHKLPLTINAPKKASIDFLNIGAINKDEPLEQVGISKPNLNNSSAWCYRECEEMCKQLFDEMVKKYNNDPKYDFNNYYIYFSGSSSNAKYICISRQVNYGRLIYTLDMNLDNLKYYETEGSNPISWPNWRAIFSTEDYPNLFDSTITNNGFFKFQSLSTSTACPDSPRQRGKIGIVGEFNDLVSKVIHNFINTSIKLEGLFDGNSLNTSNDVDMTTFIANNKLPMYINWTGATVKNKEDIIMLKGTYSGEPLKVSSWNVPQDNIVLLRSQIVDYKKLPLSIDLSGLVTTWSSKKELLTREAWQSIWSINNTGQNSIGVDKTKTNEEINTTLINLPWDKSYKYSEGIYFIFIFVPRELQNDFYFRGALIAVKSWDNSSNRYRYSLELRNKTFGSYDTIYSSESGWLMSGDTINTHGGPMNTVTIANTTQQVGLFNSQLFPLIYLNIDMNNKLLGLKLDGTPLDSSITDDTVVNLKDLIYNYNKLPTSIILPQKAKIITETETIRLADEFNGELYKIIPIDPSGAEINLTDDEYDTLDFRQLISNKRIPLDIKYPKYKKDAKDLSFFKKQGEPDRAIWQNSTLTTEELMNELKPAIKFETESYWTSYENLFRNCQNISWMFPLPTDSKVTNFSSMFADCPKLETITYLDIPAKATLDMMFANCKSLDIRGNFSWLEEKESSAEDDLRSMYRLFYNSNLTEIPNSLPKIYKRTTSLREMFNNCTQLGGAVKNWHITIPTTKIRYIYSIESMFENTNISEVNNFTVISPYNFHQADCIFRNCKNLITVNNLTIHNASMSKLFDGCTNLKVVTNLDIFYDDLDRNNLGNSYYDLFKTCTSLTTLTFKSNILGDLDLTNCSLLSIEALENIIAHLAANPHKLNPYGGGAYLHLSKESYEKLTEEQLAKCPDTWYIVNW